MRDRLLIFAKIIASEKKDNQPQVDGYPVMRRLNRIERVSATFKGLIQHFSPDDIQISFDNTDVAIAAACEIQRRCAVLPQNFEQKVAICIGIHGSPMAQRKGEHADDLLAFAKQIARLDDGIVISPYVKSTTTSQFKNLLSPHILKLERAPLECHKINWRAEQSALSEQESNFSIAAHGGVTLLSQTHNPAIILRHQACTTTVDSIRTKILVGRAPSNDIIISDDCVSRIHCAIEWKDNSFFLHDKSTNGSCVVPDNSKEIYVKHQSVQLIGKGIIILGRPFKGERRGGIRYEIR